MSKSREDTFSMLRKKMENAGFVFETEQIPNFQHLREKELKFIHPNLELKFEKDGLTNRAKKFYIKPLSDEKNSDIGLTTGKTSPLFSLDLFPKPNAPDTHKNEDNIHNAWVNNTSDNTLDILLDSIKSYLVPTLEDFRKSFSDEVVDSLSITPKERQKRLNQAAKKPEKTTVTTVVYKRNPDVVAEVLIRAKGKCEDCFNNAPFIRNTDNTPYLEVHHKIPLSRGGDDTVENALALCPNCHRKQHFG